jgi:hypothetical protein
MVQCNFLAFIVKLHTLIFVNNAHQTLIFCKGKAVASILLDLTKWNICPDIDENERQTGNYDVML